MRPVSNSRIILLSIFIVVPLLFSIYQGFSAENASVSVESRLAQLEAKAAQASGLNSGDNAWLLVSSALVLMMTAPGLILFYGGLVRQKNVLGTMMHSLVLMAVVSVLWVLFGYSMAFGDGNAFVGNPFQHFLLRGVGIQPNPDYAPTVPAETFMLFQMMFAIITPALISGAVAERIAHRGRHSLGVVHVTLHTSIRNVPGLLSAAGILEKIRLIDRFLRDVGGEAPRIGVCALNPHAGEAGLFGDEERHVIEPAVNAAAKIGIDCAGPLPADTLLKRAAAGEFDGVVAMYHDQGHIALKLIGWERAVNVTLGLPIVRTSPSHGTAFDIAWKGRASGRGMIEAVRVAAKLARSGSA
jgi:hypothetical protein